MAKSRINLIITFDATADTERVPAKEIAVRVGRFLAVDMDLANVRVEVDGAVLDYRAVYEADREAAKERDYTQPDVLSEQYPNQGFAEGVSNTLNANRLDPLVEAANEALALDESNLWGNPAKDQSN